MNIAINVFYIFPIMLELCLMLSMTHYAQKYVGIIGGSLPIAITTLWITDHEYTCTFFILSHASYKMAT